MDDIPPRSYGRLLQTTLRIVTWNVWGRYGPWAERETAIAATLQETRPDLVVLTESWSKGGDRQCARLAGPLGLPYYLFSGVAAQEDAAALSGVAARMQIPVKLTVDVPRRPPPVIEAVAYFVVSEGLTNITKHAQASQADLHDGAAGRAHQVPAAGALILRSGHGHYFL